MKRSNFNIEKDHAINVDGLSVDLHNNYDFDDFSYSVSSRKFIMKWRRTTGDWVPTDCPHSLRLTFQNVGFLKVSYLEPNGEGTNDNNTLSFMGYLHPDDVDVMDGFLDESDSGDDYHAIFAFEGGLAIKIFSDSVTCGSQQNS